MPIPKFECNKKCGSIFSDEQECKKHEINCAPMVPVNNLPDTIDKTDIVCIIDKSGSMESIQDDAIGGFNNFIEEQKQLPGKATMTIVLFNHSYQLVCLDKPLDEVGRLSRSIYHPNGTTSLLDAIGRTITDIDSRKVSSKVIVSILTDGQENSSTDYSKSQISDLIQAKRAEGWEFVFLAANQDAFAEAGGLGIDVNQTVNFDASADGLRTAYQNMTNRVRSYRQ